MNSPDVYVRDLMILQCSNGWRSRHYRNNAVNGVVDGEIIVIPGPEGPGYTVQVPGRSSNSPDVHVRDNRTHWSSRISCLHHVIYILKESN